MQAKKALLCTYKANHSSHRPNPEKKKNLRKHLKHHLFAQGVSPACEVVVTWCMKPQAQVAPSGKGSRLTLSLWMLFLALQNKDLAFLSLRPWSSTYTVRFQFYERSMLISFHKRGVFHLKPWHKTVSPLFSQCGPFTGMEKKAHTAGQDRAIKADTCVRVFRYAPLCVERITWLGVLECVCVPASLDLITVWSHSNISERKQRRGGRLYSQPTRPTEPLLGSQWELYLHRTLSAPNGL